RSYGGDDRIRLAGFGASFLETIRVLLSVLELERVVRHLGHRDALDGLIAEHELEALFGSDADMVVALRTNVERRRHVAVEDHLPAVRAFDPEIVGCLARARLAAEEAFDARTSNVLNPIHDAVFIFSRAERTAEPNRRTNSRTGPTSVWLPLPSRAAIR